MAGHFSGIMGNTFLDMEISKNLENNNETVIHPSSRNFSTIEVLRVQDTRVTYVSITIGLGATFSEAATEVWNDIIPKLESLEFCAF